MGEAPTVLKLPDHKKGSKIDFLNMRPFCREPPPPRAGEISKKPVMEANEGLVAEIANHLKV